MRYVCARGGRCGARAGSTGGGVQRHQKALEVRVSEQHSTPSPRTARASCGDPARLLHSTVVCTIHCAQWSVRAGSFSTPCTRASTRVFSTPAATAALLRPTAPPGTARARSRTCARCGCARSMERAYGLVFDVTSTDVQ
ncbi:hypothetical protein GGX14DRAFT_572019 [Mycena pura]|uniref:Uncharacterized protein n=1 Tax=Mycena pura TaxID=153505 RepID=A0AAD6V9B9_9AGAR|nr:hypothetical protein GGX14DRAFT_572019 [Mycena pura]